MRLIKWAQETLWNAWWKLEGRSDIAQSNRWFSRALYWIRSHTFHRYHILDLRAKDYKWGWKDRCDQMYYACFNLLVDFMEKEDAEIVVDWEECPSHSHAMAEMKDLYHWWIKGRFEEEKEADALYAKHEDGTPTHEAWFDKIHENEEKWDINLKRLIEIRPYMWT
jgi:hypothetical protein